MLQGLPEAAQPREDGHFANRRIICRRGARSPTAGRVDRNLEYNSVRRVGFQTAVPGFVDAALHLSEMLNFQRSYLCAQLRPAGHETPDGFSCPGPRLDHAYETAAGSDLICSVVRDATRIFLLAS